MFRGDYWFAWYPVIASNNGLSRIAWLEYVWRDRTFNRDGSVAATHYYSEY